MREKYIEESFPRYFIFGEYDDGIHVDVASIDGDIVSKITREDARRLISERDKILDKLIKTALKFAETNDKEFTKFWYPNVGS